jgi:hypothetical protein
MPDIMEAIRAYIVADTDITVHVGEVVPEGTGETYVYLQRSGEMVTDELCNLYSIDGITVDVECVSSDINVCRSLTTAVKKRLRGYPLHSQAFTDDYGVTRTIHGFRVEDHDDTYIPKGLQDDSQLDLGALDVMVMYGGS